MKSSMKWLTVLSLVWLVSIISAIGKISDQTPVTGGEAMVFLLFIAITIDAAYTAGKDQNND